jgi:drug/metabolite transporter (DMT)-like permease
LSQAVRDVYFGRLFQSVDFFAVVVIAFLLSTVIFGGIVAVRVPAELARLRPHIPTVVAVNVTTALAWSCYFFALTHLEPAIVNTVHSGMAPLTVLALGACGVRLTKPDVLRRGERFAYAGIALSVAALWHVVLSGYSSLPGASQITSLVALAAVTISGSSITVSLLYCKRLQDRGISADTVTLVRYPLLVLLAGCVEARHGRMDGISGLDQLVTLAVAATALIVLPLFICRSASAEPRRLPHTLFGRSARSACSPSSRSMGGSAIRRPRCFACLPIPAARSRAMSCMAGATSDRPQSRVGVEADIEAASQRNGLAA